MKYEIYVQYENENDLHEQLYYRKRAVDAVCLAGMYAKQLDTDINITWWSVAVFDNSVYPPRMVLEVDSTDE